MNRVANICAVIALVTSACSSGGDDAGREVALVDTDPTATFCADWATFDALTNSDVGPTEEVVQEVIGLQDAMSHIVPDGLEADWTSILDWNRTFIDYFQTAGYEQPTDEMTLELLGGEDDAAQLAFEVRSDAYEAFAVWSRQNCPTSNRDTFCERWSVYDGFMESDLEPTKEIVAQLLEMQAGIDDVLPPELSTAWSGIVEWNQAFIDVFERAGYQQVTTELFLDAFGGDEEAAGAAEELQDSGFETIREWTSRNCTGTGTGSDTTTFCENWDDFAALTADDAAQTRESYDEVIAVIDRVGGNVPTEIDAEWTAIVDFARRYGDVMVSTNFDADRITPDLLEQAFGSVQAYEESVAQRDAAGGAITRWSLTGCGDFCSRWPDFRQALNDTSAEMWWVGEGEEAGDDPGRSQLAEHIRTFEIGSRLVPAEISDAWELAVEARRDWIAWWDSFDYDGERWDSSEVRERGLEIMREASYLTEDHEFVDNDHIPIGRDLRRVIAAWQDGADGAPAWLATAGEIGEHEKREIVAWLDGVGDPPEWLVELWHWGPQQWFGGQIIAALDGWVSDNCEAVTDRPGTVAVLYPRIEGAAGDAIVTVVMAEGATVEDLAEAPLILAGWCESVGSDPWGAWIDEEGNQDRWQSETFRAERWNEDSLCDYRHEVDPPLLEAGAYTLVMAVLEGQPSPDAPMTASACAAIPIHIDGETVIEMPEIPPCEVDFAGGGDPWRNPPPVDPSTPGVGTLQIVFPDLGGDGGDGEVMVVVLPAGTTLNDVGREQVWPAGATRTWLFDTRAGDQEQAARDVRVPVAELPASGLPRTFDPHWLAEEPSADRLPLAFLAPGDYDVHVHVAIDDPPEDDMTESAKNDRCVSFEVTIDGDTIADLPDLGKCPRVP